MSTKQQWGNACWYLFHTLSFKIKDGEDGIIEEMMGVMYNVCVNLPCPECSEHAKETFELARRSGVKVSDKKGLQAFWWQFHNHVNRRTRKEGISLEAAQEMYSRGRLDRIIINFRNVMGRRVPGERSMMYTMSRDNAVKKMFDFIQNHKTSFVFD